MAQPDLVVVGGGIAGLTVALSAAEAGLKVVVLERQPRLGGRARGWKDPTTGDPVSIGPHVVTDPDYLHFFKLLRRIGTIDKLAWQAPGHFMTWMDGEREIPIDQPTFLPAPFSWLPALYKHPLLRLRDVHASLPVIAFTLKASEEELLALDGESGLDFLRRFEVTENMIDQFWRFACHAICNVPIEEVSACALIRFMQRLVGTSPSSARIGFANCGLGDLLTPAKEQLEQLGAEVRLRTEVLGFEGDDEVTGVVLEGEVLRPRLGVVVTLPASDLHALLPERWHQRAPLPQLSALKPCAYLCTYIWFDRKVTDKQFWARTFTREGLNCDFYDFSNIFPGWTKPSFIGTNCIDSTAASSGGQRDHAMSGMSDDEVFAKTLAEIRENIPLARDAKVLHWTVNRVPQAIYRPVVGTERLRPRGGTTGVRGLFLAGDYCDTQFPCSMESAACGGYQCAEAVLSAAGQPQALVEAREPLQGAATLLGRLLGQERLRPLLLGLSRLNGGQMAKL